MAGAPQERWGNQLEYLLSCLGYAVGIGNVWRFPYLCYKNGGGAFLIPYFLTLFICGIPLVYLETTLGQFSSSGCIAIFNISPLLKGAGYAAVVLNIIAIVYFSAIMAYPLLYMYHSFNSPLPWQSCGNSWNTERCTEITGNMSSTYGNASITTPEDEFFHIRLLRMSSSINEVGGIVWPVFWCNVICWVVVYLCICNGVKSVGKAGLHVITLLDSHVAIACVPVVCLLEIVAALYTYGPKRFSRDVLFMTGKPLHRFWIWQWKYVLPVILVVITIYTLREASGIAGWCVALSSVVFIPIYAAIVVSKSAGPLLQRIRASCSPNKQWGPSEVEVRRRWLGSRKESNLAVFLNELDNFA
ncbi:sodium- and chloride-dependent glycine transporter 1-like [Ostrinia furnacalis]|uniref:sodium- and chloride-dependent glycine transporter 1-like n=1 Tax=Ostrinia furnacalis TaxID=93504 RepID=UPI00104060D5|nr:sodium- and chloride-dependent glycine transporter 1-like [Ostrinia furnacalis]